MPLPRPRVLVLAWVVWVYMCASGAMGFVPAGVGAGIEVSAWHRLQLRMADMQGGGPRVNRGPRPGSGGSGKTVGRSDRRRPRDPDIGPPPDLPSLLLHERIVYLGMPIVPQVTELIVAQLLYLNYESDEPVTMYINSPGTNSPDGRGASYETEAFAIADTMQYIRCPIATVAVGQAWGTAAMLLALGQKGQRYALPNASIMLHQPRSRTRGQASDIAIKAKEVLHNRRTVNELLAKCSGKELATVEKDASRTKYLSPEEAVAYGIVDQVQYPEKLKVRTPSFIRTVGDELLDGFDPSEDDA